MGIKIKTDLLSQEFPIRFGSVAIGNSEISIPHKVAYARKLQSENEWSSFRQSVSQLSPRLVNELYVKVDPEWITKLKEMGDTRTITNEITRHARGDVNLLVTDWNSVDAPSDKGLGHLVDVSFATSDCFVAPLLSKRAKIVEKGQEDKIIDLQRTFFEHTQTHKNGKGRFAYLPIRTSLEGMEAFAKFFYKQEVDGVVIDFNGCTPTGVAIHLSALARAMKVEFKSDRPLLYAINAHKGMKKSAVDSTVKPSKDIFLYELGFDLIGENHVVRFWPKNVDAGMKAVLPKPDPEYWTFSKSDYGYHLTKDKKDKKAEVKHNWLEFITEGSELKKALETEHKLSDHLKQKKYADPRDIKRVASISQKWKES